MAARRRDAGVVDEVAFVEHHEIGAGDLVLKNFFDRIVMVECAVGGALLRQRFEIVRDPAVGERRAVDHHDDAVDGDAAFDRRPVERLHQRLRQREAGGLDDDVLDAAARQDRIERRHEFVGDGAAQAAIGEFDDIFLRTGGVAAAFEDFAVDADIAELVDDDGEAAALRIGEHVADQRGLAGAEEAGDDGAGDAGEICVVPVMNCSWLVAGSSSEKFSGGTRAIRPRLSGAGRPRQGIMPSAAPASSRAPSTSAGAVFVEAAEHISPGAVAAQGRAGAARAVGEAADRPHARLPVPAAACAVAAASNAPGRGSPSGSPGRLQVMQT